MLLDARHVNEHKSGLGKTAIPTDDTPELVSLANYQPIANA